MPKKHFATIEEFIEDLKSPKPTPRNATYVDRGLILFIDPAGLNTIPPVYGIVTEVDGHTFFHYLFMNVLPPCYVGCSEFCFAEGAESFLFFSTNVDDAVHYFVRRLTRSEAAELCRLADARKADSQEKATNA